MQTLKLKALAEFQCLAGDCPDNCCRSWAIPVDDSTIAKWSKIESATQRGGFFDHVQEVEFDGVRQKILEKRPDNSCWHLNDDGLCALQATTSHDMLPQACQDYPRQSLANSWRQLETAELSCPQVVELLFSSTASDDLFTQQGARAARNAAPEEQIAMALDESFRFVMLHPEFDLNVKIYYLAKTLLDLMTAQTTDLNKLIDMATVRNRFKDQLGGLQKALTQDSIKADEADAALYWGLLSSALQRVERLGVLELNLPDERFANLFKPVRNFDGHIENYQYIMELREYSQEAVARKLQPMLARHATLAFLNRGLPWKPYARNFVATFIFASAAIAMVNLFLWLRYRQTSDVDMTYMKQVIYKLERRLKHSDLIYHKLKKNVELLDLHRSPEIYLEIA